MYISPASEKYYSGCEKCTKLRWCTSTGRIHLCYFTWLLLVYIIISNDCLYCKDTRKLAQLLEISTITDHAIHWEPRAERAVPTGYEHSLFPFIIGLIWGSERTHDATVKSDPFCNQKGTKHIWVLLTWFTYLPTPFQNQFSSVRALSGAFRATPQYRFSGLYFKIYRKKLDLSKSPQ